MKSENAPETQATKFLRQHGIAHSNHLYDYEEHGGTSVSSRELNVDEHAVVKTLVMEDETAKPLIVLYMSFGRFVQFTPSPENATFHLEDVPLVTPARLMTTSWPRTEVNW